jgi:FixJ family two-component response regulator
MLAEYATLAERPIDPSAGGPRLTATEREVLQRLAHGTPADAVAAMHEVPTRLVHFHAGLAMAKLRRAALDERRRAQDR